MSHIVVWIDDRLSYKSFQFLLALPRAAAVIVFFVGGMALGFIANFTLMHREPWDKCQCLDKFPIVVMHGDQPARVHYKDLPVYVAEHPSASYLVPAARTREIQRILYEVAVEEARGKTVIAEGGPVVKVVSEEKGKQLIMSGWMGDGFTLYHYEASATAVTPLYVKRGGVSWGLFAFPYGMAALVLYGFLERFIRRRWKCRSASLRTQAVTDTIAT